MRLNIQAVKERESCLLLHDLYAAFEAGGSTEMPSDFVRYEIWVLESFVCLSKHDLLQTRTFPIKRGGTQENDSKGEL
jgi:hypothetical protein